MTVMLTRRLAFAPPCLRCRGLAGGWRRPPHAQEASAWVASAHSALRLLAGSRGDGVLLGGIEFQLRPGGKPTGARPAIPACRRVSILPSPTMSRSVTVLWPAPIEFTDGQAAPPIGYKTR